VKNGVFWLKGLFSYFFIWGFLFISYGVGFEFMGCIAELM
jgi:hypothetical protein